MWFKNILIFRFTKPFELSPEELSQKLEVEAFTPCGSQDLLRKGWVSPMGDLGSDFVHSANGYTMFCLKRQEKIVPSAAVKDQLDEKIKQIEKAESRTVGRKERTNLKDEVMFSMLPKAFTRSSLVHGYIAPEEGLLIINSSSNTRAEEVCTELRSAIGSLPIVPIKANNPPQQTMTHWLKTRVEPNHFEFGHECVLRDTLEEKATIHCKFQELCSDQINQHLKEGTYVSKLALVSKKGIECTIDENLTIKRIIYGDIIQESARETDGVDATEQFDIDFSIMTLELKGLISSVMSEFSVPEKAEVISLK